MLIKGIKNNDILLRKWELFRLQSIHKARGFLNNHPAVENLVDALLAFYDAYEEEDGIRLDGDYGYNSKTVISRECPDEILGLLGRERVKELVE